ncbi:hypothetical protein B0T21DRAFT_373002 [Apiosordaria backusii]|uniref:Uncharacterized protein n=1 Tax=Apiosordaria backusii TaxID=314023 RepID=A0AA40AXX0_9PEZI|nr:hypothetical protein B0T21DRAFT_373002 [Apiosordaria backusii]
MRLSSLTAYWAVEVLALRSRAAVDLMEILGLSDWLGLAFPTLTGTLERLTSGEDDWVVDWLCEGKEGGRGRGER